MYDVLSKNDQGRILISCGDNQLLFAYTGEMNYHEFESNKRQFQR